MNNHANIKSGLSLYKQDSLNKFGNTVTVSGEEYTFKEIDLVIRDFKGNITFNSRVYIPEGWSENAGKILAQKYMRKTGVPEKLLYVKEKGIPNRLFSRAIPENPKKLGAENHAHQVFHRLAGCWTYWGIKRNYFRNNSEAREFYIQCYNGLYEQMFAPNSPQWFNTGLHWAYGIGEEITSEQPLFYNDENNVTRRCERTYVNPQIHACFINSISDALVGKGGIMDLWHREATIFKYGSGAGSNFSALRAVNEKLQGGGFSSGLMSFLKIGDVSAGSIKSGGTTRRAAKLVIVDADHPEVEDFIDWKMNEENKVAALVSGSQLNKRCVKAIVEAKDSDSYELAIAEAYEKFVPSGLIQRAIEAHNNNYEIDLQEFDANWESEAYQTVSGQNANNSVSVTNEFMDAVIDDEDWDLIARTDKSVVKTVKARQIWDKICFAAWCSADPGLFFHDTVNDYNTVSNSGTIRGANPCIEYQFLDDTACNLASLNLVNMYYKSEGITTHYYGGDTLSFMHNLKKYSKLVTKILDISIEMAQFTSEEMAHNTALYRTTGLGYANLGSLLMRLGMPYGEGNSLAFTEAVTSIMTGSAFEMSNELAEIRSSFPAYSDNRKPMKRVLDKYLENTSNIKVGGDTDIGILTNEAYNIWSKVCNKDAFRNAFVTCLAPTGTIGLVMDCDTTGIEPDFSLVKHKQLAGGGSMMIVNQSVESALVNLDLDKLTIDKIICYIGGHLYFPRSKELNKDDITSYITYEDLVDAGVHDRYIEVLEEEDEEEDLFTNKTPLSTYYSINNVISYLETESGVDLSFLVKNKDIVNNTQKFIFGHNTVEGCPYLAESHWPVFACAVAPAGYSMVIPVKNHINMMAAAQKYLSGAISKTVNMPQSATVNDISEAYKYAYENGVKAISVYRDGSKLSQPLMTSVAEKIAKIVNTIEEDQVPVEKVQNYVNIITGAGTRRRLGSKRSGYTQKMSIGEHKLYLRTGEYDDGSLGEIFIDMHKEGAVLRAVMNSFAIAVSIGLQYGVPLEEFFEAFYRTKFEPAGIVKDHDNIKTATSILDLIFRDLAFNYLDKDDVVNVLTDNEPKQVITTKKTKVESVVQNNEVTITSFKQDSVTVNGYTGEVCPNCSSTQMLQTGTCSTCQSCGTTTGC
jgi:ribonucleoside-diphosphate reductase alpha chain